MFLFLRTDDFWQDYYEMVSLKINFVREPKVHPYGTVWVFEDMYGNLWDLVELEYQPVNRSSCPRRVFLYTNICWLGFG